MNYQRPVALITGASRGIGRSIAGALGDTHRILVGGRDTKAVAEVIAGLPDAQPLTGDLTNPAVVHQISAELKSLDVLVHSAGMATYSKLEDTDLSKWRQVFELNVFAVAELTRLLLPALRRAYGLVVVINSGAGYISTANNGLYSASKFALRAFTDALRAEEHGRVRVCSIHPGRVDTKMQVNLQEAMGNKQYNGDLYLSPESVANVVRMVVDTQDGALIEELSIRPTDKL